MIICEKKCDRCMFYDLYNEEYDDYDENIEDIIKIIYYNNILYENIQIYNKNCEEFE